MLNRLRLGTLAIAGLLIGGLAMCQSQPAATASRQVQYARDILPILSANCLVCHGQDEKNRKAGLRLDIAELATANLKSGARAIVPGDVKASELIARINAEEPERMPPAKSHKALKTSEKELLARWI